MSLYVFAVVASCVAVAALLLFQFWASTAMQDLCTFTLFLVGAWITTGLDLAQGRPWWASLDILMFALIATVFGLRRRDRQKGKGDRVEQ